MEPTLLIKKSFFEALNGFEGNNTIASGDDVFLLQKALSKSPENVHYLKSQNTIVTTNPVNEWKALFYQRVRWASKTGSYQSCFGIGLGIIVFGGNLSWLLVIGCSLFGYGSFYVLAFLLTSKLLVDFALIKKTNAFLKTKTHFYFISSLCYPFFSVGVALYSLFGKYEWKGRSFSK